MKNTFASAVRTRLELATPGVTGRYSKPTELPHQFSVSFPFGITKVRINFDSANFWAIIYKKRKTCIIGGLNLTGLRSSRHGDAGYSFGFTKQVKSGGYWTSICLRAFSGSSFLTFAMATVRTPFSTLAEMLSRSASSGRSIVCWNLV